MSRNQSTNLLNYLIWVDTHIGNVDRHSQNCPDFPWNPVGTLSCYLVIWREFLTVEFFLLALGDITICFSSWTCIWEECCAINNSKVSWISSITVSVEGCFMRITWKMRPTEGTSALYSLHYFSYWFFLFVCFWWKALIFEFDLNANIIWVYSKLFCSFPPLNHISTYWFNSNSAHTYNLIFFF